jgi:hypothetical protein
MPIIWRVGGRHAEVDLLAGAIERNAVQSGCHGLVLGIRERDRVVDFEVDLAVRDGGVLAERIAHALGVLGQRRDFLAQGAREIEAHGDRLVDAVDHRMSAARQREQFVVGKVDAVAGQLGARQHVDGDEQNERAQKP